VEPPQEAPLHFFLLLLCFFLSGFAALLYETAWAREFAFVFGTSELAVVCVLAAYMAGLAAGSAVVGRLVPRIRRPVLVYGVLEMGIALSALGVPWAIRGATWLLTATMGGRSGPPGADEVGAGLFYVAVAFAVLAVPTGLMGATLPLLARHAVRREEELGLRVGTLYAVNTLGAVAGTAAAGFFLLPILGLRSTVFVGAATNALVFVAAVLLARWSGRAEAARAAPAHLTAFHWILPLTAISGAVSFSYEVLWTRLIGQIVGGTIQGFATMLGSFLLGIALGSAAAARLTRDRTWAVRGFAAVQLGIACLSYLAFLWVGQVPALARSIGAGNAGALAANVLVCALVLLPASLCIGAVFPFAVRLLARDETEAGPAAARVYVWNTVGSISGALAAGFFLLPALRFEGTLSLGVGLNLALALAAAAFARPASKAIAAVALAGLAALLIAQPQTPWAVLRHSAMLQNSSNWGGPIGYYSVGRSSTVLLFEQLHGWRLTNNGLPESLIAWDGPAPRGQDPARWLGMLPSLLRPEIRDVLVIGLGGGLTSEAVPSSVENVTVIELEEEVVRAHEWLATVRKSSPLHDPRLHLVVNDARGALQLTDARFGGVVSQPSHPWTAGASHLYTREFFTLAARHLEPGGIFVQWLGLTFCDESILRSLVATLLDVFPHVALFRPASGAVLFAASDQPIDPIATAAVALEAAPSDYARAGLRVAEDVASAWQMDGDDARSFALGAPVITDDRNPFATHSARIGAHNLGRGVDPLFAAFEPLADRLGDLDALYLVRRLADSGAGERALRLAKLQTDEASRQTAIGWVNSSIRPHAAGAAFQRALAGDPGSQAARFGLLRRMKRSVESGDPGAVDLAAGLEGTAAAVATGWRRAAAGDWSAVGELEPSLAAAGLRDPSQPDALRLRIQWRIASEDPTRRAEAAELARELLWASGLAPDLLLCAEALAAGGRNDDALRLLDHLSRRRRGWLEQKAALRLLDEIRPDVDAVEWGKLQRSMARRRAG
jgi:spermidine synthase